MRAILLITRRELAAYLRTWTGYIVIALLLFLDGLVFNAWGLGGPDKRSSEVLSIFFWGTSGLAAITASIVVTMRLLAEERQLGTLQLLYSSPVRDFEIVLGKYLAALVFLLVILATTLYMPMLVMVRGKISWGHVAAGYTGLALLGSAVLAIGILGSALARSQVIALIITAVLVAALVLLWNLGRVTERPLSQLFASLALWHQHFPPFQAGIVHLRDVVYYLAVTYVALFGAVRVLEARRWR